LRPEAINQQPSTSESQQQPSTASSRPTFHLIAYICTMTSRTQHFFALMEKEFRLEFRQRYAIGGILLYVFSMVFVVYSASSGKLQPQTWSVLYWMMVLFASINAVAKSFAQENSSRQLYYYQIADPATLVFAKVCYNTILLLVLELLTYLIYGVVAGNPVRDPATFFLLMPLGALGLSLSLTFVSAIAGKANNSATMMAILSFPIILPQLLSLLKLSGHAIGFGINTAWVKDVYILLGIDGILIGLIYILFPFLWRE
jgi:heme exporter protein B